MNDQICKNCKYWDFDSGDWRVAIMRRDPKDGFGLCQLLSTYDQEEAATLPAMGLSFSEGIGADFIALPTFGCNQFESRQG